jgi:xanthine/CO dehydrogenase XdhC/CoxF family maturation factor
MFKRDRCLMPSSRQLHAADTPDEAIVNGAVAAPPPRLIAVGAIDIAVALCEIAHATGWRTYGLGEHELDRLSVPVGLDLGAQSNEETARSILAEIIATRHDRPSDRPADAAGRIHPVVA